MRPTTILKLGLPLQQTLPFLVQSLGASPTQFRPMSSNRRRTLSPNSRFPFHFARRPHTLWSLSSHRIAYAGASSLDNPDGHTSELRCSLPLHILDYRLLDEAKSATAETRRLLLGGPEVPEEGGPDHEQLPSYPSHIRDRIANMYLPDQAVLRVFNPWIHQGISPVQQLEMEQDGRQSDFTSGVHTPLEAHYVSPPIGHGDLEYVNSELLLFVITEYPSAHRDDAPRYGQPTRNDSTQPIRWQENQPISIACTVSRPVPRA